MTMDLLISFIAAISLGLTALYVVLTRRHVPTWKAGAALLFACTELTLAHALLKIFPDLAMKVLCYKLTYVGFTITPTAFLCLALHYSGNGHVLTNRTRFALSIFPAVTAGLIFTNDFHGLMWNPTQTAVYAISGGFLARSDAGIWYWLFVIYSYLIMGIGCYFLIQSLMHSHKVSGELSSIVIFAPILAILGSALDIFQVSPLPPFTASALGLAIGSITVAYTISPFRQRMLLASSREAVFYNISDGLIVIDGDSRVVDVNPAAEKLMGRPALQVIGKPLGQLLPALSSIKNDNGIGSNVTLYYGEMPKVFEMRMIDAQGWPNQVASRVIVLHDITTYNQVESELQERQFFIERVARAVPEIIFVTDLINRETPYLSESLSAILGYEENDIRSGEIDWYSLIHPEDISTVQQNENRMIGARDGEIVDAEYRMRHKHGSWRWLHSRNVVFARDPEGHVCQILSTAQDVTDWKRTERLIQIFNETVLSVQGIGESAKIFDIVSDELKQLDFSCAFFELEKDLNSLKIKHYNFPTSSLQAAERLLMRKAGSTAFPVNSIEVFGKAVREKQSIFVENTADLLQQFPEPFSRFAGHLIEILKVPKAIVAPLVVDGQVIGLFTVHSGDLQMEDVPVITAFTHQLAAAWVPFQ